MTVDTLLNFTYNTTQSASLLEGSTDLEIITDFCYQFRNYEILLYFIPLILLVFRWTIYRLDPQFLRRRPKLAYFVAFQIDVLLFTISFINLYLWAIR